MGRLTERVRKSCTRVRWSQGSNKSVTGLDSKWKNYSRRNERILPIRVRNTKHLIFPRSGAVRAGDIQIRAGGGAVEPEEVCREEKERFSKSPGRSSHDSSGWKKERNEKKEYPSDTSEIESPCSSIRYLPIRLTKSTPSNFRGVSALMYPRLLYIL